MCVCVCACRVYVYMVCVVCMCVCTCVCLGAIQLMQYARLIQINWTTVWITLVDPCPAPPLCAIFLAGSRSMVQAVCSPGPLRAQLPLGTLLLLCAQLKQLLVLHEWLSGEFPPALKGVTYFYVVHCTWGFQWHNCWSAHRMCVGVLCPVWVLAHLWAWPQLDITAESPEFL